MKAKAAEALNVRIYKMDNGEYRLGFVHQIKEKTVAGEKGKWWTSSQKTRKALSKHFNIALLD